LNNGRPTHDRPGSSNLNLSLASHRIEFFLGLFGLSSDRTSIRHLLLNLHALVDFSLFDATVPLRVSFFFHGVEDTTEVGKPLD
jgi:hypothetical protein